MSKFKVGDTIRRTDWDVPDWGVHIGQEYKVIALTDDICRPLYVDGVDHKLNDSFFELVQAASEQPAVLTPLEVAEAMLAGTELQFKRYGSDVWRDLPLRKNVVHFSTSNKYRKKPTTVLINGISVPAPAKLSTGATGYTPAICHNEIHTTAARDGRIYWSTEAEAQEVLDAIMTSFSK